MTAQTKNRRGFWQGLFRRDGRKAPRPEAPAVAEPSQQVAALLARRGPPAGQRRAGHGHTAQQFITCLYAILDPENGRLVYHQSEEVTV